MDRLALLLDRKMRLIPNWTQLARELRVDEAVISRMEQYNDYSPTIQLFDYLEATQPNLSIQQLRQELTQINRNDLNVLITNAGFKDYEKVREVITSRHPKTPTSPQKEILDQIALALDGTSLVLGNWYNLAIKFGVSRKECWKIGAASTESPTNLLFQYLEATRPQMKLKKVVDALCLMTRQDLLDFIAKQNFEDEVLLKDIMIPGSEFLQTMADKLNRVVPAVENWKHLAFKLEIPNEEIRKFGSMTTEPERTSPTIEVLKWVAAKFPDTRLTDVVRALDRIQRNDAIKIITEEFIDSVDQSLQRYDSSLHDSLNKAMPINDPTGRALSVSLSSKVTEDMKRTGHCGRLPERTDLVGRNEICENIATLLTSNKSVEIVAPPGYGKTSAVIEVAHGMIERGKFIAYVKPRGVSCVEDLASKIIEALGFAHGEDTVTEVFRRICSLKGMSVILIIENIDDLMHLEDQISDDEELKSKTYCAKMRGKYLKDDFFTFFKDIGQISNVHLVLTSRETYNFSVSFPIEVIDLEPLNDKDSAALFTKSDANLDNSLIKELVRVCGGIPLIICTVLLILKRENPKEFTERLSSSSPSDLVKELNPEFMANEDRIDKCLEICFKRLSQENQRILVMFSTFPYRFTQKQFRTVFESLIGSDLQKHLNCLKQSSLLRFDRESCHYFLHPFIRDYFSLKPEHNEMKSVFLHHYSDLAVTLYKTFLSNNSKSAIKDYRAEKDNIREAIAWCGDDHHELEQTLREKCINAFNKAAVFLAKMMRKQEFESLFCNLARRCRYDMPLYSACLTHIGMKIVLGCTCSPFICSRALYRAKSFLSNANDIQSKHNDSNEGNRAQCLSKLGFCCVREGRVEEGYELLEKALKLRRDRAEKSNKSRDKVKLAACFNDLAASQMVQRKHLLSIQTRLASVLPVYEENLGDHPATATTLNWIGKSYYALGDYDNAIKYSRRSNNLRQKLLGPHQETARSLYDLGEAFSAKGEYETALNYLKEAVKLQEEVLDTHDELIHTHQTMSIVLCHLGKKKEAEEEMKKAEECAKNLDSWKAPLERLESREEKGWMAVSSIPEAEPRISKF